MSGASTETILDRIVAIRRLRLEQQKAVLPFAVLGSRVEAAPTVRDFAGALLAPNRNGSGLARKAEPPRVIAELKRASPSRGVIRQGAAAANLALWAPALEKAGAAAFSVLTEPDFFQGSLEDLVLVRRLVERPVLRKDFILDRYQVLESRAAGADSFLLIAAILDDTALGALLAAGRELGMEALVEVHNEEELRRALRVGAKILGVNNRDLKTFEVDLQVSFDLVEKIPEECLAISESGIRSAAEWKRLQAAGYDAFLIGERLMEAEDPAVALKELLLTDSD
jgi:indole-3-glycerol phosphate synthase